MGSEAECADRVAGNIAPISDEDLYSALADHHSEDLDALPESQRGEAVDAMVRGYRLGA